MVRDWLILKKFLVRFGFRVISKFNFWMNAIRRVAFAIARIGTVFKHSVLNLFSPLNLPPIGTP